MSIGLFDVCRRLGLVFSGLMFCMVICLTGCDDSSLALNDPGGETIIDGTGVNPDTEVIGPIEGFGSIIIDGVHYETDNADFFYLGQPSSEDELALGDTVRILSGTDDSGNHIAVRVDHEPPVTGIIQQIDISAGTMKVSGHTVQTDVQTLFAGNIAGLADFVIGDVVEISGSADAAGDVVATRIEPSPLTSGATLLSGKVTARNEATQTFVVVSRTVDISNTGIALPQVGDEVVVEGEALASGVIVAGSVILREYDNSAIEETSLSGAVSYVADNALTIVGESVLVTPDTLFENGTLTDIQAGSRLRVLGSRDQNGNVIASTIIIVSTAESDFLGVVDAIEITGQSPSGNALGYIIVNGSRYSTQAASLVDSRDKEVPQMVELTDLKAGMIVNLKGVSTTPSQNHVGLVEIVAD